MPGVASASIAEGKSARPSTTPPRTIRKMPTWARRLIRVVPAYDRGPVAASRPYSNTGPRRLSLRQALPQNPQPVTGGNLLDLVRREASPGERITQLLKIGDGVDLRRDVLDTKTAVE